MVYSLGYVQILRKEDYHCFPVKTSSLYISSFCNIITLKDAAVLKVSIIPGKTCLVLFSQ